MLANSFASDPDKELHGFMEGAGLLGIIALGNTAAPTVTISNLGVDPGCRRRQIGTCMVEYVAALHRSAALQAETDGDAVEFYRKLGFRVESLGAKYAGVERFLCTLLPLDRRAVANPSDGTNTECATAGISFRRATLGDLPDLAALYASVFAAPPWNERWTVETAGESLRKILTGPGFLGIVAILGSKVTAAVLGERGEGAGSNRYSLREMYVDTAHQRRGIGTAILRQLEAELTAAGVASIGLMTAAKSPAHAFYGKRGFAEVSTRVVLQKDLGNPGR